MAPNDQPPLRPVQVILDGDRFLKAPDRPPGGSNKDFLAHIDALFAIEREINGQLPSVRLAVRRERSKKIVDDLETWLRAERRKLSSKSPLAKAIAYSLNHWPAFARFLDDGRICLSNNAAERAVRGIAVGRRNWTCLAARTPAGGALR